MGTISLGGQGPDWAVAPRMYVCMLTYNSTIRVQEYILKICTSERIPLAYSSIVDWGSGSHPLGKDVATNSADTDQSCQYLGNTYTICVLL